MKNKLLVLISCLFFIIGCKTNDRKPLLFIPDRIINMGIIKFDSSYSINYSLINKGTGTLIIDTATASCGCSVPSIKKKVIVTGDSTLLAVTYKPVDTGVFNKKIVVKSNADSIFSIVSFKGKAVK